MQQIAVVPVFECPCGLNGEGQYLAPGPATRFQQLRAIRSLDAFRRDERETAVDAALEIPGDVGVVEPLKGEHFRGEALYEGGIANDGLGENLDGGAASGVIVAASGVHDPERPAAEFRFHEPVADAGPDHAG